LGAGVLVAEVQTPSDTTYRLYDWERVGLDGQPRELHVDAALECIQYELDESQIVQRGAPEQLGEWTRTSLARCAAFDVSQFTMAGQSATWPAAPEYTILMSITFAGIIRSRLHSHAVRPGQLLLMPPNSDFPIEAEHTDGVLLRVRALTR
jgi:mannose-6-phosphate isomerase